MPRNKFWIGCLSYSGRCHEGYYNLPSLQQIDKIFLLKGEWHGEWKNAGKSVQCTLTFFAEGEYLKVNLISIGGKELNRTLTFKLYGEYFHLFDYDSQREITFHLELEILNDNTLLGENVLNECRTLFIRQYT